MPVPLFSAQSHKVKELYTAALETLSLNHSSSTLSLSGMLSRRQDSCVTQAYEEMEGKPNAEHNKS